MTSPGRPRPSTSSNITSPSLNRFPLRPSSFNDSRISSGTSSSSPLKARTLASPRPSSNLKPNGDFPLAGEKSSSRTLPAQKSFRAIPSKVPTYKLAPPPSAPASSSSRPSSTAPPVESPTKGSMMGKETLRLRPAGIKDTGRMTGASRPVDGSAKGKERERPREEENVVDRRGNGFVDGHDLDRRLPLAPEDSSPEPSPTEVSLEELGLPASTSKSSALRQDRSEIASSSLPASIPLPPSPSTTPSSTPTSSQPTSPSPSRPSSSSDIDLEDRADQEDDSRSDAGDGTNDEEEVETEGMRTSSSHGSRSDVDEDQSRVEWAEETSRGEVGDEAEKIVEPEPDRGRRRSKTVVWMAMEGKDAGLSKRPVDRPRNDSPLPRSNPAAELAAPLESKDDDRKREYFRRVALMYPDGLPTYSPPDDAVASPPVDFEEKESWKRAMANVMKDLLKKTESLSAAEDRIVVLSDQVKKLKYLRSEDKVSSNRLILHQNWLILHHRCQTQIVGRRGKIDSDLAASDPVPAPLVEEPEVEGLGRVGVFAPGEGIDDMMATTRRQKRMNYLPTGFNPSAPPSPSPRFKSDDPLDRFSLFPASKNAPKTIAALANLAGSIKSLCHETRRHPSSTTSLSDLLGLASKIPTDIFQCIKMTSPPVTEPKGNRADFWRTVNLHLWDGMVELRSLAVEQGRKGEFIEEEEGWTALVNVEDVRNKLPVVFAVLYELGVQVEKVEAKAESRK